MNIGYGLAALDSYYKEGDARKSREYVQAKRDSELSTLGDRTEADRSGYQLRTGQNRANSELLPSQTANAKSRLGLESVDLEGQAQRQPDEIRTKAANAKIGLANAENDEANVPSSLAVKNNTLQAQLQTSDATLKQLPMKLQQLATQGVLDQRGQSEVVLGTMGQLIARQDKAGALAFANDIAKVGNILPNTNGKQFTDIRPVRKGENGAQGDGYNFVTSDGQSRFVPVEAISGAMGKLKSGEYQFLHTGDGSVYSGNKVTGQITQAYKGDPKASRGQNTPAEIQTMEYLVSKGVAKDVNQAWDMVRSSREKTRSSFVMDYVSKNALPGADTNKMSEDAGRIYDTLRTSQGPASTSPTSSNSQSAGKFDPAISSLIGIP
jgi:hypothetical protein